MWNRRMKTSSLQAGAGDATRCMTSEAARTNWTRATCLRRSLSSKSIEKEKMPTWRKVKTRAPTHPLHPRRAKRRLTGRPEQRRWCQMLAAAPSARNRAGSSFFPRRRDGTSTGGMGCSEDREVCFPWCRKKGQGSNAQDAAALPHGRVGIFNNG